MANLPPALDFAKTEEEICEKWAKENTFKTQDALSLERGDEVRIIMHSYSIAVYVYLQLHAWYKMKYTVVFILQKR